jgi:cobalt-zinc-cadmium efflux system outer membrane protein
MYHLKVANPFARLARQNRVRRRDWTAFCSLSLGLAAGVLAGCTQIARKGGFADVEKLVADRGISQTVRWHDGSAEDRAAEDAVREILGRDLTAEGAVQVALLRNPSLQSTYEELGIAQANLVQAGLLSNPVFAGAALLGGVSPSYDFDVLQNFVDLLLRPARQRIAAAQFEEVRLRVAGEVFDLAARVRGAYFTLQGAEQVVQVLQAVLTTSEAGTDLAQRLRQAGNINDLRLAAERGLTEEVRAELMRATSETIDPREDLRRLMGVSDSDAPFEVPAALPGLPADDPSLGEMLALAKTRRLELAAAHEEEANLSQALETARLWRFVGVLDVGAMTHREQGKSNWIAGPNASLELPVFDQRQAQIARLESEVRRSRSRASALALDVAADVRRNYDKLRATRALCNQYRAALIPLREQVVALSQQFYDAMLLGAFELFLAKQAEIKSYRDYVAAVRDYWIAVAGLERAVGARLPSSPTAEPTVPPVVAAAAVEPAHHSHGGD